MISIPLPGCNSFISGVQNSKDARRHTTVHQSFAMATEWPDHYPPVTLLEDALTSLRTDHNTINFNLTAFSTNPMNHTNSQ